MPEMDIPNHVKSMVFHLDRLCVIPRSRDLHMNKGPGTEIVGNWPVNYHGRCQPSFLSLKVSTYGVVVDLVSYAERTSGVDLARGPL